MYLYTNDTIALTLDTSQNATFAGNVTAPTLEIESTSIYQAKIKSTGAQYLLIGSTDAGSAGIVLDGDSNGDGSGGDYSYLLHEATGVLKVQQDSPSGTNELHFGTAGIESRMIMTSAGNVNIGSTSNAGYRLKVEGTGTVQLNNRTGSDGTVFAAAKDGTIVGSITVTGSATAFNTSSDYRLKEDLQDFAGLDMVSKIPVYDFKWKVDDSRSYGVLAHELEEVLPQAVDGEKDAKEMQSVDYSKIVPVLVKAIQELSTTVEELKTKLNEGE
jgi:hypothetical protein